MAQQPLLGVEEGQRRKVEGKAKVSSSPEAQAWLRKARAYVVWHLTVGRSPSADPLWKVISADVVLQHVPLPNNVHPNVVGSLFNDSRFIATGEWRPNTRPDAHARKVQCWRLR